MRTRGMIREAKGIWRYMVAEMKAGRGRKLEKQIRCLPLASRTVPCWPSMMQVVSDVV